MVAEVAAAVRERRVSAVDLVTMSLERIDRLDPPLGAVTAVFPERALEAARALDERGAEGRLAGLPLLVKDTTDVQGLVTNFGSRTMLDRPPAKESELTVERMVAEGAIVVGRTNVPEFAFQGWTANDVFGATGNPWALEWSPGGSSGGSGAAVAAGLAAAALGTDGAGSIRIPAAACGLFGLKPQRDRVPRTPHDADGSHWIVFGALTRSVLDTALVLDAIAASGPGGAAAPRSFADAARARPGRLRIAASSSFPRGTLGRLSPDVARALEDTAALLRSLGHEVVPRDIDFGANDAPVIVGLLFRGMHDFVADVERPERLERRSRAIARPGALISDRMLERLRERERRLAARVGQLFDEHDVLLTPVLSRPPVRAGLMEGRGAAVTYLWATGWVPFNVLWNSTGQPAASVPAGFTADGLPLAVQLVGRPHDEATLLSLAAELEAARPWADRRPPLSSA